MKSIFQQIANTVMPTHTLNDSYGDEHEFQAPPILNHSIDLSDHPVSKERQVLIQLADDWKDAMQQQRCEILSLKSKIRHLENALSRIDDLDPNIDSNDINEWAEVDCLHQAQKIAHDALNRI